MNNPSPALQPLRVLIVEDLPSDYELLVHQLKKGGFAPEARRVQSAIEMQEALASSTWDFIISDFNVPGFGALPALALLQATGLDIPFLLMSGAIGEAAAVEAMRSGAEDYVPKDNPVRLVPAIRRGLEAAAARRERRSAQDALSAVAANLPGMLFLLGTDKIGASLRFTYASEGCQRLFGATPEAVQADAEVLLAALEPADRVALLARLSAASRKPEALHGEFRLRARAGAPGWVQFTAHGRPDGQRLAWDGLVVDITPLKQAESRLLESQAQLRHLTAHLERAKEVERADIAREIHDDIGGTLTAMKADLASLARRMEDAGGRARLESLGRLVDGAMKASQSIARALRPAALDQGIYPALSWQARDFSARHGVPVNLACNVPDIELDPEISTALYRIFQEGLTNIAKHAHATAIEATLFANASMVTLEIRDDGRGVDPSQLDKTGSFGVFGMLERVRNLGGWLEIESPHGQGTTLMASLPLRVAPGKAA
jgi:two-component system sensor histidine kinase UhpB